VTQSTDAMIRELAATLAPVKPLGRVRDAVLIALGVSLPFYGFWIFSSGVREQFAGGTPPSFVYSIVALLLLAVAAGGVVAGLASAVPGREDAARLGRKVLFAALMLGFLVLGFQLSSRSETWAASILDVSGSSLQCAMAAAMLSIPSALLLGRFTLRGAARHVPISLALALVGGMGVSSAAVHLTCSHPAPIHLILGHGFAPFAGGLATLILASVIAWLAGLLASRTTRI
jgi:hypothetical protein